MRSGIVADATVVRASQRMHVPIAWTRSTQPHIMSRLRAACAACVRCDGLGVAAAARYRPNGKGWRG
jgi:hypothetical protein